MASFAETEYWWISSRHYHELPLDSQETPLLHNPHRTTRFFGGNITLMCLAIFFLTGVAIGTYLLCIEGEAVIPERFSFVARAKWSPRPANPPETPALSLPTERVLFLLSNTSECRTSSECITELRKIREEYMDEYKEPDIQYNFIVAGDGRIYEGRGWEYESAYLDDGRAPLTVAFLGKYEDAPPSDLQDQQLRAFLDYAVMESYLVPCFKVLVRDIPTRYIADIAFDIERQVQEDYRCRD